MLIMLFLKYIGGSVCHDFVACQGRVLWVVGLLLYKNPVFLG